MNFGSILMRMVWRLAPVLWLGWAIRNLVIDLPDHRPDDDDDFLAGATRIRSSSAAAGVARYYESGLIRGPPSLPEVHKATPATNSQLHLRDCEPAPNAASRPTFTAA